MRVPGLQGLPAHRWYTVMVSAGFAIILMSLAVKFETASNQGFMLLGWALFWFGLGVMASTGGRVEFHPAPELGGVVSVRRSRWSWSAEGVVLMLTGLGCGVGSAWTFATHTPG